MAATHIARDACSSTLRPRHRTHARRGRLPNGVNDPHRNHKILGCNQYRLQQLTRRFHRFRTRRGQNTPGMKIQITTFIDASTAIAIGLAHPLADVQALLAFTKDWAATNRALSSSKPLPEPTPLFIPSLLSNAAAGNIDGPSPDPAILEISAKLPYHRLDYWASSNASCPEYAKPLTAIPPELKDLTESGLRKGTPIPWHEWDVMAPASRVTVFLFRS